MEPRSGMVAVRLTGDLASRLEMLGAPAPNLRLGLFIDFSDYLNVAET